MIQDNSEETNLTLPGNDILPGFEKSYFFNEQEKKLTFSPGISVLINVPGLFNKKSPTKLIFYPLPRDCSIKRTIGSHAEINFTPELPMQHIGAQVRRLREIKPGENLVIIYLEAERKSWTVWKDKYPGSHIIIKKVVDDIEKEFADFDPGIILSGHSAGGNFTLGYIESVDSIPPEIERITFLESNYSYSNENNHGQKILQWLKSNSRNFLSIIAYDDRRVRIDGKAIIEPGKGTYRKTNELLSFLEQEICFSKIINDEFTQFKGLNGQIDMIIHNNKENLMLHTRLVGEMNGFIHSITSGTKYENIAGEFNGPNTYENWIQPF